MIVKARGRLFSRLVWVLAVAAVMASSPSPVLAQLTCEPGFTRLALTYTGAPRQIVVPPEATTIIARAIGAGGGSVEDKPGGSGALVQGTYAVAGGGILHVLVGGTGSQPAFGNGGGGGGGASFVGIGPSLAVATPIVIAGGGGGAGRGADAGGGDAGGPGAVTPPSGTTGGDGGTDGGDGGAGEQDPNFDGEPGGLGGTAGNGGEGTAGCGAGGGAGLDSNGGTGPQVSAAIALASGGAGGQNTSVPSFLGGFGGGGAPSNCGGGGGGYSGGGAGGDGDFGNATTGGGGGGGSLNAGSDQLNNAAFNPADTNGLVELCVDAAVSVPATPAWLIATLALLLALGAAGAIRRQTRLA